MHAPLHACVFACCFRTHVLDVYTTCYWQSPVIVWMGGTSLPWRVFALHSMCVGPPNMHAHVFLHTLVSVRMTRCTFGYLICRNACPRVCIGVCIGWCAP